VPGHIPICNPARHPATAERPGETLMMIRAALASAALSAAFALATLSVPAPAFAQAAAATATLTINIDGIKTPTGAIMVAVFDSEAAHDKGGKPAHVAMVPVSAATATNVIPGLAPGRYAVKLFHDVNGNGQMDSNPFGMPLEPFAFSNNALPQGGPATWGQASFDVPAGAATTSISFR
jgi:uncharacterized protein (DUF2141 family)